MPAPLTTLELRHSTLLPTPLRLVLDNRNWTTTLEDSSVVTFYAAAVEAEAGDVSSKGKDERQFAVADPQLVLWRAIVANIGGAEAVTVVLREYDAATLTAPASVSVFELDGASLSLSRKVSFGASTPDVDFAAPRLRFTSANSPAQRR